MGGWDREGLVEKDGTYLSTLQIPPWDPFSLLHIKFPSEIDREALIDPWYIPESMEIRLDFTYFRKSFASEKEGRSEIMCSRIIDLTSTISCNGLTQGQPSCPQSTTLLCMQSNQIQHTESQMVP